MSIVIEWLKWKTNEIYLLGCRLRYWVALFKALQALLKRFHRLARSLANFLLPITACNVPKIAILTHQLYRIAWTCKEAIRGALRTPRICAGAWRSLAIQIYMIFSIFQIVVWRLVDESHTKHLAWFKKQRAWNRLCTHTCKKAKSLLLTWFNFKPHYYCPICIYFGMFLCM